MTAPLPGTSIFTCTLYSPHGNAGPYGCAVSDGPRHCTPGQSIVPVIGSLASVFSSSSTGGQQPTSLSLYCTAPAPMSNDTSEAPHGPQPWDAGLVYALGS